jgi:hypothetical protein
MCREVYKYRSWPDLLEDIQALLLSNPSFCHPCSKKLGLKSAMGELKGEQSATQAVPISPSEQDLRGSATEPKVGELLPGEAEAGGLGRHRGLWSTVALMFVFCLPPYPITQALFSPFLC